MTLSDVSAYINLQRKASQNRVHPSDVPYYEMMELLRFVENILNTEQRKLLEQFEGTK